MENKSVYQKITKKISVLLFLSILFFILYCMGQWLIPFIIALILAYALHAPTRSLSQKLNISQTFSAGIFVLLFVSVFAFFAIFMIPLIKNAILVMVNKIPQIVEYLPTFINQIMENVFEYLGIEKTFDIGLELQKYLVSLAAGLPSYFINFLNTGMTLVYVVMFAFMTPILTFYLLKDWNKIEEYIKIILNKVSSQTTNTIINNINRKLAEYVKGQLLICLILSFLYSLGLFFIGTSEFFTCGIVSGVLSFAPFFGPFLGLITTFTMSIDDFAFSYQYVLLCCLYIIIPFLDSNFLTPRFIGKKTGIHPFWILFSICATVSILGTIGIFISVPMAVILSTVCRELVKKI